MRRVRRDRLEESDDTVEDVDEEQGASPEEEISFEVLPGEKLQEAQDRIEDRYRARATSPLRAIRAFCVLCMGAQPREVAKCTAYGCVLYPMRNGTNPFQKRK